MTTAGHILPGYVDPPEERPSYSQRDFRRVKTAYAGRTVLSDEERRRFGAPIDSSQLDEIREAAKNLWLQPTREPTTYLHHYRDERVVGHPPALNRPTSPTRKNKPHPEPIFLTCRLHHVPGYHNPDTSLDKDAYIPDRMTSGYERWKREEAKAKYLPRPSTAAVHPFRPKYPGLENLPDSRMQYATEAWLNIVNDDDREKLLYDLKHLPVKEEQPSIGGQQLCRIPDAVRSSTTRPKTAKPRLIYQPVPRRGDFLLHPKWPPTLPRHKLPCMC